MSGPEHTADPRPSAAATPATDGRVMRAAIWFPGLVVALGAAVATMHGLYEVALASRVPPGIAWLYPLITDGLALVAYAATARLSGRAARYAWTVVVIAAGLSGLAQAVFLAADPVPAPPVLAGPPQPEAAVVFVTSPVLRFGVGAWPAIAAAVCAHLLFLLIADHAPSTAARTEVAPVPGGAPSVQTVVQPSEPSEPSEPSDRPVLSGADAGVKRPTLPSSAGPVASDPAGPSNGEATRPIAVTSSSERAGRRAGEPGARDRARTAAQRHHAWHGELPTVSQLMALAEVSRGTAGDALKSLREQPTPLRVVHDQHNDKANP